MSTATTSSTTADIVAHYREHGYAIVRGALSAPELAALQDEAAAQIEAGPDRAPASDFFSVTSPDDGSSVSYRVNNLQDKQLVNDSMLLLLGNPAIVEHTTAILGADAIPYANALIVKGGPQALPPFGPHRDSVDLGPDGYQTGICSVDVYLDDATADNGCLMVVPDSHRLLDVRPLVDRKWEMEGLVPVHMEAGDVLLHDGMVIHGSHGSPAGAPYRRVVYPTFQSAGDIMGRGLYNGVVPVRRWVTQWMKLLAHAVELRRKASHLRDEVQHPYAVPAEWQADVAACALTLTPSLAA